MSNTNEKTPSSNPDTDKVNNDRLRILAERLKRSSDRVFSPVADDSIRQQFKSTLDSISRATKTPPSQRTANDSASHQSTNTRPEQGQLAHEITQKTALEREVYLNAQQSRINSQVRQIRKPSQLLYSVFVSLMFLIDVLDLMDLTGIGIIIARIIQVFATIISMSVAWHSGRRIKTMSDIHSSLSSHISQISHRIAVYRQRYARGLRMARKLGLLKKGSTGAKWVLKVSKYTKFTRAPVLKSTIGNLLEFSPVGILPWQAIFAAWTYYDHKSAYKHAIQAVPELRAAQSAEAEEFSQSQISLYDELANMPEENDTEKT